MEMERYDDGVPSWIDLGCPDVAAAGEFYTAVFGWEVVAGPPEAGGYAQAFVRGRPVAGLGPQQNPGPPYWTTYVNVTDVDATAAKVTANGGQVIVPPMDVLTAGRMAVFVDAVGAFVSAWQAGDHLGAGIVNEHGTLCWNELVTDDIEGASQFYAAVFGWDPQAAPDGSYVEFHLDGRPIGGMMPKPDAIPPEMPSFWSIYFAVDDCDAAVAEVLARGGAQLAPTMDIPIGRFAPLADPWGAVFSVITLASAG